MKTLGKLQINPEKRINNDELLKLKGGDLLWCYCINCQNQGYMIETSCYWCLYDCAKIGCGAICNLE